MKTWKKCHLLLAALFVIVDFFVWKIYCLIPSHTHDDTKAFLL